MGSEAGSNADAKKTRSNLFKDKGKGKGKDRPGLKALLVGALVLAMTVPLFFISIIAEERKSRAETVMQEVAGEWSRREQTLAGPFLVIPIARNREFTADGRARVDPTRRYLVILPEELHFQTQAVSEILHRGIYQAPVFTGEIVASGSFPAVDPTSFPGAQGTVLWHEAFVTLSLSDPRGIRSSIVMEMDEREFTLEPGAELLIYGNSGAHVSVPGVFGTGNVQRGQLPASALAPSDAVNFAVPQSFRFGFTLHGASRLRFVPVGRTTTAAIRSDWTSPSFQGAFLPISRTMDETGFTANWTVPNLARSFPDQFLASEENANQKAAAMSGAAFGVDFIVPLNHYQKIFRALRYAVIFIGFTFLAFFLVEIVLKTRLHAVQYFLIGAAQSIFYLLLLSASEHIGFGKSFVWAAAATVSLITVYGGFISRSLKVGVTLLGVLSLIYFILYSLLQVEDLALLYGSMALFGALALTMLVTRNVNWYGEEKEDALAEPELDLQTDG